MVCRIQYNAPRLWQRRECRRCRECGKCRQWERTDLLLRRKRERKRERICEEDEETIICSRTLKGCRWIVTDLGRARFAEQAGRPHCGRCPGPECKPSTAISLHPLLRCERHVAPASHLSLRQRLLGFETLYHAQPSDNSCSFLQTTLLRTPGVADAALWARIAEREWRADRLLHQCPSGRGR